MTQSRWLRQVCPPPSPFHHRPTAEADAAPQIPGVKKMCRGKKTADHASRGPGSLHSNNNVFVNSLKKSAFLCPSKHPRAPPPKKKIRGSFRCINLPKKTVRLQEGPLMSFSFCGYYVGRCVIKNRRNVMLKFERRERSRETDPPSVPFRRNSEIERREECRQAGSILLSFPNFSQRKICFLFSFLRKYYTVIMAERVK